MQRIRSYVRRLAAFSVLSGCLLWIVTGCSVRDTSNVQRKSCSQCMQEHGTCIGDHYCLMGSDHDAGSDASLSDAATESPDSGDATVYANCTEEGKTELCYEGADQATSLQPPCRAGTRTCTSGQWGECEHQRLPADETCNGEDDDCDGKTDEQLANSDCTLQTTQGACSRGTQVCLSGSFKCLQSVYPQSDVCNGEDDDCDGNTDEATQLSCYPSATDGCSDLGDGNFGCRGACSAGERACVDGSYAESCEGAVTPESMERCTPVGETAADEDCDGQIDEDCACNPGMSCYTGSPAASQQTAPCHAGMQACSDATHGTCQGEVTPQLEDCSNMGQDDDCDGVPDNVPFVDTSCADQSEAKGACKAGARWQCQGGQQVCVAAPAATERCDGQNVDEDCDGKVDEGFSLTDDPNNCGACGVTCGSGLLCCNGSCVDTSSSRSNCASCGHACASGETCCASTCVNTKTDGSNCGVCGQSCLLGCSGGRCNLL